MWVLGELLLTVLSDAPPQVLAAGHLGRLGTQELQGHVYIYTYIYKLYEAICIYCFIIYIIYIYLQHQSHFKDSTFLLMTYVIYVHLKQGRTTYFLDLWYWKKSSADWQSFKICGPTFDRQESIWKAFIIFQFIYSVCLILSLYTGGVSLVVRVVRRSMINLFNSLNT